MHSRLPSKRNKISRPKLIITADDYGMSPRFNQGILEAAHAGLITGISVMIKRKYIRKIDLLDLPISIGLHLELEVVSPYNEVTTQIERFKQRFGRLPAYLDGHQHQHLTPKNLGHVIRAAKQYDLPIRSRLSADRTVLKKSNVTTPDNFISWHPDRLPVLKERLRLAHQHSLSEIVAHPGYYDRRCHYRYNRERQDELGFLRSPDFQKFIQPFQLIQYADLGGSVQNRRPLL